MKERKKTINRCRILIWILICMYVLLIPAYNTYAGIEVHFIDVGQADSQLIVCDGEAMLIDGGDAEDSSLIYSYLRDHGITHLKYIIATHPDEDHIGGLAGALNYADAENAFCSTTEYDNKAFSSLIKYLGDVSLEVPEAGNEFSLGNAECLIVGPVQESEDSNNNSLVIKVTYGDTSFLFAGDAEEEEEQDILQSGYDITCDVLKVGHHGSASSTSLELLEAIKPTYAVISCGKENSYHHPTDQTLERLAACGIQLYRTDMQGHVVCSSDGYNISFDVTRNPDADTYSTYDELYELPMVPEVMVNDRGQSGNVHTYMLNTNSKKIHTLDCKSVKQMSDKNKKEVTGTFEEIMVEYGNYTTCGNCHAQY